MSRRALAAVLAMVVSVALYGCGPDCRLICERQEDANCEGGADMPDCERECMHEQDLVTNAGCETDFDNYLACLNDLDDMCDAVPEECLPGEHCKDPKCDNEADDLGDCVRDYCTHHPHNNECELLVAPAAT